MSNATPSAPAAGLHNAGVDELRRGGGWFIALGAALVILGTLGLGASVALTLASVVLFGWLLIACGVLQGAHAFWRRRWSGFFIDLLLGTLYGVMGCLIVAHPAATAIELTLIIALFMLAGGAFRIATALAVRYPNWPWVLINGVISMVLGVMIVKGWPESGFWVIGMFIAIDMIFNGWSLVMLGIAARKLPTT